MAESAYTDISNIGEFGLIKRLTKSFKNNRSETLLGIGDDAAVWKPADGLVPVVSTDLLIEGVHFDLSYMPLRHLGYKAVVVNISDIFAMNAEPVGVTISVAISNRFPVEAMDEFYEGVKQACDTYGVDLLGGDTSSAPQGLIISVTAMGQVEPEKYVTRNGAKPKDLICVTGDVGAAYAGFLVLDREKAVYLKSPNLQPDLNDYDYVVGRQLKPEARMDVLSKLREANITPTSMMDISDGVASELFHLSSQSKTGVLIYAHKLPIDPQTVKVAEEFKISPTTFALNGGEDYELMFTVPLEAFQTVGSWPEVSIIGHMTPDAHVHQVILENGETVDLEAQGWQHFQPEAPTE